MVYCGNAQYELDRAAALLKSKNPDDLLDAARRLLKARQYLNGAVPSDGVVALAEAALADERLGDLVKALGMLCLASAYGRRGPLVDAARGIVEKYYEEVLKEYKERYG